MVQRSHLLPQLQQHLQPSLCSQRMGLFRHRRQHLSRSQPLLPDRLHPYGRLQYDGQRDDKVLIVNAKMQKCKNVIMNYAL